MLRSVIFSTIITACLLLMPAFSGNAAPSAWQDSGDGIFGIGLGYLTGNTLYHIAVTIRQAALRANWNSR